MVSCLKPRFFILLLLFLCRIPSNQILQVTAVGTPFLDVRCDNSVGNYTYSDGIYRNNLKTVISTLISSIKPEVGFYNVSFSDLQPNGINMIAMCRGDVSSSVCRTCLNDSTVRILNDCDIQKRAVGFYDECYAISKSIFGYLEEYPTLYDQNHENAPNQIKFVQDLEELLTTLRGQAASGNSLKKFAIGKKTSGDDLIIYGLMQCTPDLNRSHCERCLTVNISNTSLRGKIGGKVLKPSCNLRFEINRFYEIGAPSPSPSPSPAPPSPSPQSTSNSPPTKRSNRPWIKIIIIVSSIGIFLLGVSFCIFIKTRRKLRTKAFQNGEEIITAESLRFEFGTIRLATNNFSSSNMLGQGGFGVVYKGVLLNGQEIAVKRLSTDSGQGDIEFMNEVLLVAKLQHRNLVRLLGFCLDGSERLLIYEFLPNVSLDHFLFDPIRRLELDWQTRYKIINGIVRGLVYLHEDSRLRIIHRDLKASNILLDEEMNPKISDFGMAKLFLMDETPDSTSRIVGTYGYMAPEYIGSGQLSVKLDVFSFGVLILEIISGEKRNCFRNEESVDDLLSYAWGSWREGTGSKVIDQTLGNASLNEIMRCIHIGLLCVQENPADRPAMASVVLMLNSHSLTLRVPSRPAFFIHRRTDQSDWSSSLSHDSRLAQSSRSRAKEAKPVSVNEVSITELDAR